MRTARRRVRRRCDASTSPRATRRRTLWPPWPPSTRSACRRPGSRSKWTSPAGAGSELPSRRGLLINDAYNANPVSMRAALAYLAERAEGRRRVAILGDMAELGRTGPRYHREIGEAAVELGVDGCSQSANSRAGTGPSVCGAGSRRPRSHARGRARPPRRCGPHKGLTGDRSRSCRSGPREDARLVRVLVAGVIAMVVSIVVGPKFIEFLRRNEFGQHDPRGGARRPRIKQGTPTMGGLLILLVRAVRSSQSPGTRCRR